MKKLLLATAILIGLAGLNASSASARYDALPKVKNHLVIPGKSIGGLKLGTGMGKAKRMWQAKKRGHCENPGYAPPDCWFVESRPDLYDGAMGFFGRKHKVEQVYVTVGLNGRPSRSSVTAFVTPEGIRIGSSVRKLRRTYGSRLKLTREYDSKSFKIRHHGRVTTEFLVDRGIVFCMSVWKGKELNGS